MGSSSAARVGCAGHASLKNCNCRASGLHCATQFELAANKDAGAGAYNCPCYKSPKRGGLHFVFDVDLRTEDPPARWILRGVCLLTTKD